MDLSHFWVWVSLGVLFAVFEIFTGTFYLLLISVAAFLTAILTALIGPLSWEVEGLCFAVLAFLSAWYLKSKKIQSHKPSFRIDEESVFTASDDVDVHEVKNLIYQGSPWSVMNVSEQKILKGQQVKVVKTEGIRLLIKPSGGHS